MKILFLSLFLLVSLESNAQCRLRIMEWNVENLFDTEHDSLKNDKDFLPSSPRHWTRAAYWRKLNKVGQGIIAGGLKDGWGRLPDLVGLCEVENDSTMIYLTERSLLRKARYKYVMTASPDERGIDVALLYSPFSFRLLHADTIRIKPMKEMKPTRDILHVAGEVISGDTLHIFLIHAPSRSGGEIQTRPFRKYVSECLCAAIDSVRQHNHEVKIIVMGDFNDYAQDASLKNLYAHSLVNISEKASGTNGAKGTYKYKGAWGSLDQILISKNLLPKVKCCFINDEKFLMEEDKVYGGFKPRRTFNGMRQNGGYSDHLPLILDLTL